MRRTRSAASRRARPAMNRRSAAGRGGAPPIAAPSCSCSSSSRRSRSAWIDAGRSRRRGPLGQRPGATVRAALSALPGPDEGPAQPRRAGDAGDHPDRRHPAAGAGRRSRWCRRWPAMLPAASDRAGSNFGSVLRADRRRHAVDGRAALLERLGLDDLHAAAGQGDGRDQRGEALAGRAVDIGQRRRSTSSIGLLRSRCTCCSSCCATASADARASATRSPRAGG